MKLNKENIKENITGTTLALILFAVGLLLIGLGIWGQVVSWTEHIDILSQPLGSIEPWDKKVNDIEIAFSMISVFVGCVPIFLGGLKVRETFIDDWQRLKEWFKGGKE